MFQFRTFTLLAALAFTVSLANAQEFQEDFEGASGSPGATVIDGQGFGSVDDPPGWDDNLAGENAFAGTAGRAQITATAEAVLNGGAGGSAGGRLNVFDTHFNLLDHDFDNVAGSGGGSFLMGDGATPDTFGFTLNWDDNIINEAAFGGTFGGAVLVGTMSAEGEIAGGMDGGGGARVDVDNVDIGVGNWYAGLQFDIGSFPGAAPFQNPGFEQGGIGFGATGWETYGNALTEAALPNTGAQHLKLYGTFSGNSGAFQSLPASEGQTWEIDAFSAHVTGDSLQFTGNTVVMKIEFFDAGGGLLLIDEAVILNDLSSLDTYIDNAPLQLTAPATTAEVRGVLEFVQNANDAGAAFIDDVSFGNIAGSSLALEDFELTAEVRGTAGGAGEVLGDIQLRIEDLSGNRVIFPATATGGWQTLGGFLNTGTEADASGVPSPGAFNLDSAGFKVVVAFDNETAGGTVWGTGGTLEVDDLLLPNTDPGTDSAWFGGLFWNNIPVTASALSELSLTADVQGSEIGGAYQLRMECFKNFQAGLNESFTDATGDGGDFGGAPFLAECSGDCFNFTNNWDSGISGESAFGGTFGNADILAGGGFTAQAITSGGNPGLAGEIRAEGLSTGPGGGWFAGLSWPNQGLASDDLTMVTLTADVRGLTAGGGTLGEYELRIEDAQGDRLFICGTANGNWQPVGGTLASFTEGPALSGGDGTFNLDAPPYTVVVAFSEETAGQTGCDETNSNPWTFGGVLQVDNLVLTPVDVSTEVGRAIFSETASGSFETVGGNLGDAETTFGSLNQDFSDATGTGGVTVAPYVGAGSWDDGFEGEDGFYGTFDGADAGTATYQACLDCGNGGGKAGQMIVSDVILGGGGWFAVAFFPGVPADFSGGDLDAVSLTADMQGIADGGAGQTLGTYFLRVEDSDLTALSFTETANGSYQQVGGPLGGATLEQIDSGDGVFDINQTSYTVTVGVVGDVSNWGPGATLNFDNLFMTGVDLGSADVCTVVVAYDDELPSWGLGGSLTIDNINLTAAAGCEVFADCGDSDDNGIRDDACTWYDCDGGSCVEVAKSTQADIGGGNGACPIDGACDGNDNFHALNCFSNRDTFGNTGYPCEPGPPSAVNVDAGGSNGSCILDGVCDGNDNFHALNCFSNQDTLGDLGYPCSCTGPQPDAPAGPVERPAAAAITLRAPEFVRAGELVDVEVLFDDALEAVRGYQLHLGVRGGEGQTLELVDIAVDAERKDWVFAGTPGVWQAYNRDIQQMVAGMNPPEGVPTPAGGYLATFSYRVPEDASGSFVVDLRYDGTSAVPADRTFLFGENARSIEVGAVTPAAIEVLPVKGRRGSLRLGSR